MGTAIGGTDNAESSNPVSSTNTDTSSPVPSHLTATAAAANTDGDCGAWEVGLGVR